MAGSGGGGLGGFGFAIAVAGVLAGSAAGVAILTVVYAGLTTGSIAAGGACLGTTLRCFFWAANWSRASFCCFCR